MPSLEGNSSTEQGGSKMIFETQCITQKSKEVKSRYQVHCFLDNSLWNQPPTHLPATERSQNSSVPMRSSVIEQQTRFCQKHLLNRSYQRICRQIKSPSNKKKRIGQGQNYLRFWKMLPRPIPRPLPLAATEERKHQGWHECDATLCLSQQLTNQIQITPSLFLTSMEAKL